MTNQELCQACAFGSTKHKHNYDSKTCRFGRLQTLNLLPESDQIEALRSEERMSASIAETIVNLAKERKKTILEVMQEEALA